MIALLLCAFFVDWVKIAVPMNIDWKTAARCISDRQTVYVFPGRDAPSLRRVLPCNRVIPIYDIQNVSIPDDTWVIVNSTEISGRHSCWHPNAVRVRSICAPSFSIELWKKPKGTSGQTTRAS